ncbi:MAG: imidazole glycerol phosphate synthase subunit HisH [Pseudomonadota bacterium]
MSKIAIIDYGMGNLHSVSKAVQHLSNGKVSIKITSKPQDIKEADKIIFPGQGAARECMKALKEHNLIESIHETASTRPFLGICMGMQVLMENSTENGNTDCLGLFKGTVKPFSKATDNLKIPHMGWNQVKQKKTHPLWQNIENDSRFYFVHSYYVAPDASSIISGETNYGIDFTSVISENYIFAMQCHPEKSSGAGLKLLKNFLAWNGNL